MKKITASRYHDICAGHRVVGHEGKCRHLHGHNYRIHFDCTADQLDSVGRVIDFTVIKERLCEWLETEWDHRMLLWESDAMAAMVMLADPSIVLVPFNPTAENMAEYLATVIAPKQLEGTGVTCSQIRIEETAKCSATYSL